VSLKIKAAGALLGALALTGVSASAATAADTATRAARCVNPVTWGYDHWQAHGQCDNAVLIKIKAWCHDDDNNFEEVVSRSYRSGYNNVACPSGYTASDIWILPKP
jgi:hypothetical protein